MMTAKSGSFLTHPSITADRATRQPIREPDYALARIVGRIFFSWSQRMVASRRLRGHKVQDRKEGGKVLIVGRKRRRNT
jgi:hypothetical protein